MHIIFKYISKLGLIISNLVRGYYNYYCYKHTFNILVYFLCALAPGGYCMELTNKSGNKMISNKKIKKLKLRNYSSTQTTKHLIHSTIFPIK